MAAFEEKVLSGSPTYKEKVVRPSCPPVYEEKGRPLSCPPVYEEKVGGLSCPRVSYSYGYRSPSGVEGEDQEGGLEIQLRCPRFSSFGWCLRLYSLVLGGLGLLLSSIWVCFQLYVLSQTTNTELRLQRYLDILLGLVLLLSLVCLLYAGYSQSRIWIIAFITASLAVVLTYWCWFLYIKASGMDFPDSEEITGDVLAVLSCIYGFLLLPVVFFYRSLELVANHPLPIKSQGSYSKRKSSPKYEFNKDTLGNSTCQENQ